VSTSDGLMTDRFVIPVGLEEGPDGATLVHALALPGCVGAGATRDEALAVFPRVLSAWLHFLASAGEPVPAADQELEIAVDEWIRTDANVAAGESDACFDADLRPLTAGDIDQALRRLGMLRGALLARIRRLPDAELDRAHGSWTLRRTLEELARAQWWTLSRLGASPLGDAPDQTLGRLDTAMALVVQHLSHLPPEAWGGVLDLEGETWTPRKVLRRLLWLEWSAGRIAERIIPRPPEHTLTVLGNP
jgi:predicted RNase H-like HicB family nuclease